MKKSPSHNQQVKLVEEDDQPVQLKITEEVEVLKPAHQKPGQVKTQEPDVAEIISDDEKNTTLEEEWGKNKRGIPHGWFILTVAILIGLCGWATYNVFKAQPVTQHKNEEKQELLVDLENENKEVKQTLFNMKDCIKGYLSATDVESMAKFVRHPERVKPLMEHHYETHEIKPGEFKDFERIRSMGIKNLSFVFFKVDLVDGSSRKLLIEQLNDDSFKVDWESDVCYLPMPWSDYIQESPTSIVDMRVKVTPDNFYAYEFRDEDEFQCYKLTTRDFDGHLFGFIKKGSMEAYKISRVINKAKDSGKGSTENMILRVSFPKDSNSKRCVTIHDLLSSGWTYVTPPPKIDDPK